MDNLYRLTFLFSLFIKSKFCILLFNKVSISICHVLIFKHFNLIIFSIRNTCKTVHFYTALKCLFDIVYKLTFLFPICSQITMCVFIFFANEHMCFLFVPKLACAFSIISVCEGKLTCGVTSWLAGQLKQYIFNKTIVD